LLVAPAAFDFQDGHYLSITRIFVSTYQSVVNGRINWGIPKDHADFTVQRSADRTDHIVVSRGGKVIADLRLSHHGLTVPVHSGILPAGLRTVKQHWRGKEYGVTLSAKGSLRMAKLVDARFDPEFFPDVAQGRVIAAGYLPSFDMTFPLPTVLSI
jgi:Acetoacetate decarboxylase (ADC)